MREQRKQKRLENQPKNCILQEEGNKLDDRQKISDWHTEIFGDYPRRLFFCRQDGLGVAAGTLHQLSFLSRPSV